MTRILNAFFLAGLCLVFALPANSATITLDTSPLVGHPAGPFYVYLALTDGDGIGDTNNTVTISSFDFGGGSALGGPLTFGGASGSVAAGVTISDSSFLNLFYQQFAPGLHLSFSLGLTSNDDLAGTPDRFSFFILDSSGVALPTLAPAGDYFLGADLGSAGPVFDAWASDTNRAPTAGNPVSVAAPTIASVNSVPEPSTIYLLGGALLAVAVLRCRFSRLPVRWGWGRFITRGGRVGGAGVGAGHYFLGLRGGRVPWRAH